MGATLYFNDHYSVDRCLLKMFDSSNLEGRTAIPSTGMLPTLVLFENDREVKRIVTGAKIIEYFEGLKLSK